MNKTKKTILMGLIGLVFSGVLNAQTSTNTSVEKHLDEIDARLTSTMLSYNSQEFSQTFVKKELASIDELVLRVNEQISGLPKSAIVLAYLDELEADAVKLQKLKRANSKTAVNTLYTADCFKNNLIAIEKKSVLEEMNNRGLLDETFKKVPKQLNNFVTWEELDQIAEILATKLVEKGLTLESGKLPALIEREIFTDLDAKNSEARAILDQKTVNKPDINAKRALGRIARRTLDALSFYFILNAAYQHGGIHAFHSATHGVAEVGTTIVLANVVLHVLDGYWTYKGKNSDIKKMLSVSFNNAKNMEWTKRLSQNFGESYKALTMSSNKKRAKKQVDKVMFSLLFAEKTGGIFYNQALENAIYEISEAHSPVTDISDKEVLKMMLKRSNVYSAEDILNKYMLVSNDPKDWPSKLIESSFRAKETAMDWYIALCLLEESQRTPLVESVKKLSTKFPSELRQVVLQELSNVEEMPLDEKLSLISNELGQAKNIDEINNAFDKIEEILHSNGIVSGKVVKIEKLIDEFKEQGIIGENYANTMEQSIGNSNGMINSSFSKVLSDIRAKTVNYFNMLGELSGLTSSTHGFSQTVLKDKINSLLKLGFLTKEQGNSIIEIVERPIYNINTTNIFASTSLVYDANNDFEMLEVNSEDNTKNTNVDLVKEESPKVTLADALTDSKVSSNIVGAYRSSPETFSKENIIEFINSAFLQKNRSQQIDILNKASFIVNQLSKYSTNLVPLRQSITEAEEKISKNDFEFFKSKLEQCLNSKFDNNITDEQVINKAADFILANDGRLSGAQSELMKSMVFGELSRDFHDGLLTQLDKQISFGSYDNKKDLEKKESLMFFLLIANNASLPEIKGILLDAVFAKNEFVKNIIDISKSNIDAVDLGLDKNIKDKVLEKLDEITKSIELGRKI